MARNLITRRSSRGGETTKSRRGLSTFADTVLLAAGHDTAHDRLPNSETPAYDSTWLNLGDRAGKTAQGQATGTRNKQTSILPSHRRHAPPELQGAAARWGN